ncbi:GTP 3',8-cyclase MoaA [Caenispirillum salinarum]|uniref:GTP 3',8-cyclase MoaA n=1 Tax=Caenispirillum salinarum TaxID=859058 RepID=UPI00384FE588
MLIDSFGRRIRYLRISVTDRCDLRCSYCMSERQQFRPRADLLTAAEICRLIDVAADLGFDTIRITGGEPLVRKDFPVIAEHIGHRIAAGATISRFLITTNATRLSRYAAFLHDCGVRRVNISLDTLDPDRYGRITRRGTLQAALDGIAAAREAGLEVRLNCVVHRAYNADPDSLDRLVRFAGDSGCDIAFIELMPIGPAALAFGDAFCPVAEVRASLAQRWTLVPDRFRTNGPATYDHCGETGQRIGFIAANSCGFCSACSRVRLTADGRLFPCVGDEGAVDVSHLLRGGAGDAEIAAAIVDAVNRKPLHNTFNDSAFTSSGRAARGMFVTGG